MRNRSVPPSLGGIGGAGRPPKVVIVFSFRKEERDVEDEEDKAEGEGLPSSPLLSFSCGVS